MMMTADAAFKIVAELALDTVEGRGASISIRRYDNLLRVLSWNSGVPYTILKERLMESIRVLLRG